MTVEDFHKLDLRSGQVIQVEEVRDARRPSYSLTIDFGQQIGTKRSVAQVTNYSRDELRGTMVIAVVNLPPRKIAGVRSEVLVLGVKDLGGEVSLLTPLRPARPGEHVF